MMYGALAVVVLGGVDAADQGQPVHLLGGVRQQLADVDAGHRGRDGLERAAGVGAGLGVPGFQLADAAGEPDERARAFAPSASSLAAAGLNQAAEAERPAPRPTPGEKLRRDKACSGELQAYEQFMDRLPAAR